MSYPEFLAAFKASCCCYPRRLDPDQQLKIAELSLNRYRKALQGFVAFLISHGYNPFLLDQIDDLVVEYKNHAKLSKSQMDCLIASLEFHYPKIKGHLQWSKQVAVGLAAAHQTHHTVPLISAPARLFGSHIAVKGKPRMGFGIALHQAVGFRPSEMLKLQKQHVLAPTDNIGRFVFRLGANVGTKVKREQVAYLDSRKHPQLAFLLLQLLDACLSDEEMLFPYSYATYNRNIAQVEASLGMNLGITAHSARAGFASEAVASGEPVLVVKEAGRWLSELSFRTYVDVVAAAHVQSMVALAGFRDAMDFVSLHFHEYFSTSAFGAEVHGAQRLDQTVGRHLHTAGDANAWLAYKSANSAAAQQGQPASAFASGTGAQSSTAGPPSVQFAAASGKGGTSSGKGQGKGSSRLLLPRGCRPRPLAQVGA